MALRVDFDPALETARALAQATASFIVYKEAEYCLARDGKTGEVKFKDTDARTVIQSTVNALPDGGLILIRAGRYVLTDSILLRVC